MPSWIPWIVFGFVAFARTCPVVYILSDDNSNQNQAASDCEEETAQYLAEAHTTSHTSRTSRTHLPHLPHLAPPAHLARLPHLLHLPHPRAPLPHHQVRSEDCHVQLARLVIDELGENTNVWLGAMWEAGAWRWGNGEGAVMEYAPPGFDKSTGVQDCLLLVSDRPL